MKDYLVYMSQAHLGFRQAELESLASIHGFQVDLSKMSDESPFFVVQLEDDRQAAQLIRRSVLSKAIYELWGQGTTLEDLHKDVQARSTELAPLYKQSSFKFDIVSYQGSRKTRAQQLALFESFSYLAFEGKIQMKKPDQTFAILESYQIIGQAPAPSPDQLYFGRQIETSERSRGVLERHEIAKRPYYGTTTFDAELALVSCNLAKTAPGHLIYDPFVGTGSFALAAAHYGSLTYGTDIDFRALKGKGPDRRLATNFKKYGTSNLFGDVLCMDFTHNAFRSDLKFDAIVCDPPYGVREGLKVCGTDREERFEGKENVIINGEYAYLRRDFIQPKKNYSLDLLLDDLLQFASERLPVGGRLCFWMPVANDQYIPTLVPQHEKLELIYNLVQEFNKWSRRLLVYVKRDANYKGATITSQERGLQNDFHLESSRSSSTSSSLELSALGHDSWSLTLVWAEAEVSDSLSGASWTSDSQGVGTSWSSKSQLVEGDGLTTVLQDGLLGTAGESQSSNSGLWELEESDIVSDSSNNDNSLVSRTWLRQSLGDSGDGNWWSVDLGKEQRLEDELVEWSINETNPRGIPQAKFIEKIEDFIDAKTCTDDDVSLFLKELQVRLQQYKFLEENKRNTLGNLDVKIPDIQKTLDMCRFFKERKQQLDQGDDVEETVDVNYELNDTVYSTAEIDIKNLDHVSLWLGADIMMDYPIDEAIEMLEKRLAGALENKAITIEDLEYLRSNITTMEVNTARVYNWDVQRRKALKEAEATS
ncbi:hypothetical protein OGAPHI_007128 [Ogataea philodendri]|uniref:tRNA (guanine(10)-N(2))-methyltransferase n=1 Tax=Ogataea philodendri TaxID=1378263 RepID=A0A9P8NVR5_9ASCO|nr:uncharacterized protein OGAPHI_007128 [Ogataea philodendri]KAH3660542.1 hypothetical protein OGAPHI_007128 [Ogataea philodendri]